MKTFILLTEKWWHDDLFKSLSEREGEEWIRISTKEGFSLAALTKYQPEKIFIPHWSYIIPEEIWGAFDCVVFHMTDLPYGRGGSPLQNLIVRGHLDTKISALKVNKGIDTGDIYLKADLSLSGTAQEIFERSSPIVEKMINTIIDNKLEPKPQIGDPVSFSRRKPSDSNVSQLEHLDEMYNYIRMLDADGYPKAFLETEFFRIEFQEASFKEGEEIKAHVRVFKK